MTALPTQRGQNSGASALGQSISLFGSIVQPFVSALGVLYIFGLLLINIDLARYRVVNLDLARPEYVLAGLLWVLAIVPSGVIWLACLHSARERTRRREFGLGIVFAVLGLFTAISFPAGMLTAFSGASAAGVFWPIFLSHVTTFVVNVGLLSIAVAVGGLPPTSTAEIAQLDRSARLLLGAVLALGMTVAFVVLLGAYATFSYPYLPKMMGGGRKPFVELMLSSSATKQWDALNIPISPDRMTVGPLVLLFESQQVLVVTQRTARVWPIPLELPRPAIALERGRVAAVIYTDAAPPSIIIKAAP
jgi:hypothetical protein